MSKIDAVREKIRSYLIVHWRILAFIALLAPFFTPNGFQRAIAPESDWVILVAKVLSLGIAFFACLSKKRLDGFAAIAIAIFAVMMLSTALNEGVERTWYYSRSFLYQHGFGLWAPVAAVALLGCYARHDHMSDFLIAIFAVTGTLSLGNTISAVVYPEGFSVGAPQVVNFYGHKNISIDIILPSVLTALILSRTYSRRFAPVVGLMIALGIAQCVITYSATSAVAFCAFLALAALANSRKVRPLLNGLTFAACYVISCLLILVLKVQDLFAPLIIAPGKTVTFTGRTYIWDTTLSLFDSSHLLLGYGTSFQFNIVYNGETYPHPHNFVLQVLLSGGIIGIVLYAALIGLAVYALFKNRFDNNAAYISAAVGAMLLVGLMEPITNATWPLLLTLGHYWHPTAPSRKQLPTIASPGFRYD